jgi:hypothetical protein
VTRNPRSSASDRASEWPNRAPKSIDPLSTDQLGPAHPLQPGARLDAALAVTKAVQGNDLDEAGDVFRALGLIPAGWTGSGGELLDVLGSGERWQPPDEDGPREGLPVACPTCDALPDAPCQSVVTGKPLKVVHNERRRV